MKRGLPALPERPVDDPPPPRAKECAQGDVQAVLGAVLLDRRTLQGLVVRGLVGWSSARRLIWQLTGTDLGPVPLWREWAEHEKPPPAPETVGVQWRGEPS